MKTKFMQILLSLDDNKLNKEKQLNDKSKKELKQNDNTEGNNE